MFKYRDILFLAAAVASLSIALSGRGGRPYVYQHWKHTLRDSAATYTNRDYPAQHERLPSPLITDLNGDGSNQVLVATRAPSLILFETCIQCSTQPLKILYQVSLLGSTRSIGSRHPVSLRSGYLDPTTTAPRRQSIIVVLKSWTVLCFDHRLRLQWETSASRIQSVLSIGPLVHREVASLVSSLSVVPGDRGVVIVGGSMMLRDGVDDGTFEISGDRVQEDTDGSDSNDFKSEVLLQHQRDVYYAKVKRAEHFVSRGVFLF